MPENWTNCTLYHPKMTRCNIFWSFALCDIQYVLYCQHGAVPVHSSVNVVCCVRYEHYCCLYLWYEHLSVDHLPCLQCTSTRVWVNAKFFKPVVKTGITLTVVLWPAVVWITLACYILTVDSIKTTITPSNVHPIPLRPNYILMVICYHVDRQEQSDHGPTSARQHLTGWS